MSMSSISKVLFFLFHSKSRLSDIVSVTIVLRIKTSRQYNVQSEMVTCAYQISRGREAFEIINSTSQVETAKYLIWNCDIITRYWPQANSQFYDSIHTFLEHEFLDGKPTPDEAAQDCLQTLQVLANSQH